ncbi:hypothetical protein [Pinisolibacter sp.]|uniref:hypothetical protein n=1 Tax=Pinisolibacter sp. TaxID=2172024 RepID=UPI002FDCF263
MSDRPESPPPRPSARDERAERLAAQLRANLRRRKDQTRGREAEEGARRDEPPADD